MALQSESMPGDSSKALEAKEQVRLGKISAAEFERIMEDLRRSGKDRAEPKKVVSMAVRAGSTTTGTMATAESLPAGQTLWTGRYPSADGGSGGDPGRDPGTSALGLRKHAGSDVFRKLGGLGGRLGLTVSSTRSDHGGREDSPVPEGSRSTECIMRRTSPKRPVNSPRHESGLDTATTGGGSVVSWRPWSLTSSTGRNIRRALSSPPSPDRLVPSQSADGAVSWGQGVEPSSGRARQSVSSPLRAPGTQDGRLPTSTQGQADNSQTAPLTASEIDNMSSVSNTSTVLTDLSIRLEKIEDMLARLLEGHKSERLGEGGETVRRVTRVSHTSRISDGNSTDIGANSIAPAEVEHPGQLLGPSPSMIQTGVGETTSADAAPGQALGTSGRPQDGLPTVKSAADELGEVRGRLHQLEVGGTAAALMPAATSAFASSGRYTQSGVAPATRTTGGKPGLLTAIGQEVPAIFDTAVETGLGREAQKWYQEPVLDGLFDVDQVRDTTEIAEVGEWLESKDGDKDLGVQRRSSLDNEGEQERKADEETNSGRAISSPGFGPTYKRLSTISESPL